jgi:hypothetical protein
MYFNLRVRPKYTISLLPPTKRISTKIIMYCLLPDFRQRSSRCRVHPDREHHFRLLPFGHLRDLHLLQPETNFSGCLYSLRDNSKHEVDFGYLVVSHRKERLKLVPRIFPTLTQPCNFSLTGFVNSDFHRLYVLSQSSERIRRKIKEILHLLQDIEADMPEDSPYMLQVKINLKLLIFFTHNYL